MCPRMPPHRAGAGIYYRDANWFARVGFLHAFDQDKIGDNETPTKGYTLLNADLAYTLQARQPQAGAIPEMTIGLKGENLLDDDVRNTSRSRRTRCCSRAGPSASTASSSSTDIGLAISTRRPQRRFREALRGARIACFAALHNGAGTPGGQAAVASLAYQRTPEISDRRKKQPWNYGRSWDNASRSSSVAGWERNYKGTGDMQASDIAARSQGPDGPDRHLQSELLPQGRRLPVGMSDAIPPSRIHPPDRPGPLCGRLHAQLGEQRLPGHPRPRLRSPLRARLPARPRRGEAGRHLPPEARRRRLQGRDRCLHAGDPRPRRTASASP